MTPPGKIIVVTTRIGGDGSQSDSISAIPHHTENLDVSIPYDEIPKSPPVSSDGTMTSLHIF